ncbi:RUN domain-containing protein 1-like [Panonychus citri]|uniref:RUN domain-containing protein 1-like n=1 Tax=Panonychus citri TaxID=50023 RepID=UPI002306FED7|nr:RUN domain-containing protein 1-like [Panonychus citri]XP_053213828.1 RUN domain-containing protein 1-like [Panonychus citri]
MSLLENEDESVIGKENVNQEKEIPSDICYCGTDADEETDGEGDEDEDEDDDDDLNYFTDSPLDYCENTGGGGERYHNRLRRLEDEQEQLNCSLIALTSHFAQVQLRLKQIVEASSEEKEVLLKQLEEFAFRGIPDLREPSIPHRASESDDDDDDQVIDSTPLKGNNNSNNNNTSSVSVNQKLEFQRKRQKELIHKLRDQLEELEQYAYETGQSNALPSSLLLERQTVIIEQLKGKLPLQLDQFDKSSPEDLRRQVDDAIRELVNPALMKEQLVNQLKTQVTDLERFIEFLQVEEGCVGRRGKRGGKCTCNCPLHGNAQRALVKKLDLIPDDRIKNGRSGKSRENGRRSLAGEEHLTRNRKEIVTRIIRRVVTLIQLFTFAQFGCNGLGQTLERSMAKKHSKGNHWGDSRAKLEMAITKLSEINEEKSFNDSDYTSESEETPVFQYNEKMTNAVRKEFCSCLKELIEHGLTCKYNGHIGTSLIPSYLIGLGCFSTRSAQLSQDRSLTAWDLILKYYQLKNGQQFNSCPARRLSQSFNLEIVGNVAITPKHSLLTTIDNIIQTHTKLRRSPESHLKAFICEALNQRKLVVWLKLILKNRTLLDNYYEEWSYTAATGWEDAFTSLQKLNEINFKLPTDWAIRQLQNINDAFN